ncbi:MAG: KEOPS complex kinase/ATPase Bud32 [Candidatus Nanoarchaeia archaeon]|nr:KEOPS complex kinase/ATPase Bud32 [Candidatus Nanoarchaeia archaeon]
MNPKIIQQGAEAIITLENNQIVKDRIKKSYRISVLDKRLRKSRTKSEAKIMNKLKEIISVPKIINTDEKEKIIMEYIQGKKLSEHLENLDYKKICEQIAENISKIHNQNIIHGDLTTSNMIYVENDESFKIYFIDFGLAFHSMKIEDKAVDLHLIQQALEAKHFTIWKECWKIILDNYNADKHKEILQRIKTIESRGRYKEKY